MRRSVTLILSSVRQNMILHFTLLFIELEQMNPYIMNLYFPKNYKSMDNTIILVQIPY